MCRLGMKIPTHKYTAVNSRGRWAELAWLRTTTSSYFSRKSP